MIVTSPKEMLPGISVVTPRRSLPNRISARFCRITIRPMVSTQEFSSQSRPACQRLDQAALDHHAHDEQRNARGGAPATQRQRRLSTAATKYIT